MFKFPKRNYDAGNNAVWYQSSGNLRACVWCLSKNYDAYKVEIYDDITGNVVHKGSAESLSNAKESVFEFFNKCLNKEG